MPTGYTASVMDGKVTEFKQFAMQCARAFGALVTMRDDSMEAPVPEAFTPSQYSADRLAEAKAHMASLQSMTPEQVQDACDKDFADRTASRVKYKAEQAEQNARLDAMLAQVSKWTPPSGNHVEMKKFMREQLEMSRNSIGDAARSDPIKKQSPSEWLYEQLEKAQRDIGYHAAEHEKEVERTKGRTLWVQQLRQSLA